MSNLLTIIVFLPLLGAAVVAAMPASRPVMAKWTAALFAAVDLGLTVWLVANFDRAAAP